MTKLSLLMKCKGGSAYASKNVKSGINRLKDKSHMTVSIDEEKAFGKILHALGTKVLADVELEGHTSM